MRSWGAGAGGLLSLWSKGDVSAGRGGGVVCVNFFSLVGIFFYPEPGKGKFT